MPILCLEGPSAVGKTTTASTLADSCEAFVIPEVNALFERPAPEEEPPTWYFARQIDRWNLALEKQCTHDLVLLDGDLFQPLWYNWAYDFAGWQPLFVIADFYRRRLQSGEVAFPDAYVVLQAETEQLRIRKASDQARSRRNFEKHLHLVESQKMFFYSLSQMEPGLVHFIDAVSVASNVRPILEIASSAPLYKRDRDGQLELFEQIIRWLECNKANA